MQNVLSPIVDMYQTNLEASRQLAEVVFSGTEKIDRVVIEAAHRAVDEQLRMAQTAASSKDMPSMSSIQANFFNKPDGAMPYQQELMRIFAEMQNEMGRSLQKYFDQIRSKLSNSAVAPIQAAQQRATETVVNPMTGIFSLWESAFQEVASMANKNMAAGRNSFESATSTARQSANSAAADVTDVVANAVNTSASYANSATQPSTGHNDGVDHGSNGKVEVTGGADVPEEKRPTSGGGSKRK